jgi:hypothetical protein
VLYAAAVAVAGPQGNRDGGVQARTPVWPSKKPVRRCQVVLPGGVGIGGLAIETAAEMPRRRLSKVVVDLGLQPADLRHLIWPSVIRPPLPPARDIDGVAVFTGQIAMPDTHAFTSASANPED